MLWGSTQKGNSMMRCDFSFRKNENKIQKSFGGMASLAHRTITFFPAL